jgi:hypothetical protein
MAEVTLLSDRRKGNCEWCLELHPPFRECDQEDLQYVIEELRERLLLLGELI